MKKLLSLFVLMFLLQIVSGQNTWTQKSNFPGASRYSVASCAINDNAYVGTGYNSGVTYSDWWEYNPVTGVWTQKANFGGGSRYLSTCLAINGKAYVGFGAAGGLQNDWWEYDPASNSWVQKSSLPADGRYGTANFTVDGKGYISCGNKGGSLGPFTRELWEYDPSTDTWTEKTSFPGLARYGCTGFELDGKGYAGLGGRKKSSGKYAYYTDVYSYDPVNDSWAQIADYPAPKNFAVSFTINGKAYVGLGTKNTHVNAKIYSYDSQNNSWSFETEFPAGGRFIATGVALNGKGYVGFGANSPALTTFYNDWWEFSPSEKLEASNTVDCDITFSFVNNVLTPHFASINNTQSREFILVDVSGKIVKSQIVSDGLPVNLGSVLPSGIYFAIIRDSNGHSQCIQKINIQ